MHRTLAASQEAAFFNMTTQEDIANQQHHYANIILDTYQTLAEQQSNVVWELLKTTDTVYEWEHYPHGDVKNQLSQYYYHSHPSQDSDRVPEHGHFHCFIRKPATLTTATPLRISEKHLTDHKKDNLCHLVAIAINEHSQPTAFFTVNHWVVQGIWYSAEVVSHFLDQFNFLEDQSTLPTSRWISAMVQLFKPQIQELLQHRDHVIQKWNEENPTEDVFADKRLEVTSIYKLSET